MMPPFDPSKLDPKTLMELSQLVSQLPHDQIMRMQSLMHNMMAGFDVKKDMEEFEKTLPPGFREKLTSIMVRQMSQNPPAPPQEAPKPAAVEPDEVMSMRDARLTVLRGVAEGRVSPEEAEKLLFKD